MGFNFGNTKIVADYITELTGAEQFEIVTHKYDGMAYTPLINLAKEEAKNGELPEYEGDVDLSQYDTVFIGGPVWWGTYPQVMFTFFKKQLVGALDPAISFATPLIASESRSSFKNRSSSIESKGVLTNELTAFFATMNAKSFTSSYPRSSSCCQS